MTYVPNALMIPTIRTFDRIILPPSVDYLLQNIIYDGIVLSTYRYGSTHDEINENPTAKLLIEKDKIMIHNDPFCNVVNLVKNMLAGKTTELTQDQVEKLILDLGIEIVKKTDLSSNDSKNSIQCLSELSSIEKGAMSWAEECDDDNIKLNSTEIQDLDDADWNEGYQVSDNNEVSSTKSNKNVITSIINHNEVKHYLAIATPQMNKMNEFKIRTNKRYDQVIHFFRLNDYSKLLKGADRDATVIGYAYYTENGSPSNLIYLTAGYAKNGSRCGKSEIQISIVSDKSLFMKTHVSGKLFNLNRVDLVNNKMITDEYKFMNYTGEMAGINYVGVKRNSKLSRIQEAIGTMMTHCDFSKIIDAAQVEFERFLMNNMTHSKDYQYRVTMNELKTIRPSTQSYDVLKEFRRIYIPKGCAAMFEDCLAKSQFKYNTRNGCMYGAIAKVDNANNLESPCGRTYHTFEEYVKDPCTVRAKAFGIRQQDKRDKKDVLINNNLLVEGFNCIDCGRLYDTHVDAETCGYFCLGVQNLIMSDGSLTRCAKSPFGRYK